jgi:DHA2 family multidrug resistance protein
MLKRGLKLDYFGFFLVVLGFGSLQILLDRYQREDGFDSPLMVACAVVSAVALSVLVVWEIYQPQPVMNVRLFRYRSFAVSCALMAGVGFTLITATQLLPQMSQTLMGYDATTAGLTLGIAGIATLFLMPIAGIASGRLVQPRFLACMAFCGTAGALWYTSRLDLQASFWNLSTSRLLQAIWLPFLFIPVSLASLAQVPAARNGDASALINLARNLGGSIGVSYITNMLAVRSQFHQSRLVEHLTPYDGYGVGTALAPLMHRVSMQASAMTYDDLFLILAGAAAILAPVALLLPNTPRGAVAGH